VRKRAAIFDLDGTLIDSLKDIALCCNEVLKELDIAEHPLPKYSEFVGDGAYVLIKNALPSSTPDELIQKALGRFKDIYENNIYENTKAYEQIDELLKRLEDENIPVAILSNKPHKFTLKYAERIFKGYGFVEVFGQREDIPIKPDPQAALEISRIMDIEPSDIYFIGDTATDMKTAKNAGMKAIGVLWGFRDREELENSGADFIVSSPKEMADIILR
jgi:phosphoglycolate phosphatase